jgi:hypothetical protein
VNLVGTELLPLRAHVLVRQRFDLRFKPANVVRLSFSLKWMCLKLLLCLRQIHSLFTTHVVFNVVHQQVPLRLHFLGKTEGKHRAIRRHLQLPRTRLLLVLVVPVPLVLQELLVPHLRGQAGLQVGALHEAVQLLRELAVLVQLAVGSVIYLLVLRASMAWGRGGRMHGQTVQGRLFAVQQRSRRRHCH